MSSVLAVGLSANAGITDATYTKVPLDTVILDTQSGWSNVNRRYTPTVAGKYAFSAIAMAGATVGIQYALLSICKNGRSGTILAECAADPFTLSNTLSASVVIPSAVVSMNGSTDWIELDMLISATGGGDYILGDSTSGQVGRTRLFGTYLGT